MKQILIFAISIMLFSNCGKDNNNVEPKTVPARVQWDGYTITTGVERYVVKDNNGGSTKISDDASFLPIAKQKLDENFDQFRTEFWNFMSSDKTAYSEQYIFGNPAGLLNYTYTVNGDKILLTGTVSAPPYQLTLASSTLITSSSYMLFDQLQGTTKEEAELGSGWLEIYAPANEKDIYIKTDIQGNGLSIGDTVYVLKINTSYKAI